MYITVDDIKNEISLYYPIDNRNGNKKVDLLRAYFVYSFYNVEKDYMNKILGISNGNYIDMLLSKKSFHLRLTNCQPLTTYSMASHVMHCILVTSIKTYHLVILFTLSQRMFSIKS